MKRTAAIAILAALLLPGEAHAVAGKCVGHVCSSCPHGAGDMCANCSCDGNHGGDASFGNLFTNLGVAFMGTPEARAAGQRRNAAANAAAQRDYRASVKARDDESAAGALLGKRAQSVQAQIAALEKQEHGNGASGLTPPPSVPLTAFASAKPAGSYADSLQQGVALLPGKPGASLEELRAAAKAGNGAAADAARGTLEGDDTAMRHSGDVFDRAGAAAEPGYGAVDAPEAQATVLVTPEMIKADPALEPIAKERGEWQAKADALQKELDALTPSKPEDQVKRVQIKDDLLKAETKVRTLNRAVNVQINRTKASDAPK